MTLSYSAFNKLRQSQVDSTHAALDKSWSKMEGAVARVESSLSGRLAVLAGRLPTVEINGVSVLDPDKAGTIKKIRAQMLRAAADAEARIDKILLGVKAEAFAAAEDSAKLANMRKMIEAEVAQAEKDWAAANAGTAAAGITLNKSERGEIVAAVVIGRYQNLLAASRNGNRHVREWVENIVRPKVSKDLALAGAATLAINKNTLRLSHDAHIRQAHRSAQRDLAQKSGFDLFRLEIPSGANIKPGGKLALQRDRVASFEQWMRTMQTMNAKRRGTATIFDLGMHHGDPSFITGIPWLYAASIAGLSKEQKEEADRANGSNP